MVLGLRGMPEVQGGIEKHVEEIYTRLAQLPDVQVEIVTRTPFHKIVSRNLHGIKRTPLWAPTTAGLEAFMHTFLGVLYAAVKRPHILHVHAVGPGLFAVMARLFCLRVVFTHHGFDYQREKWGFFARAVLRLGEWSAMRFSHRVITVSQFIRDQLSLRYKCDMDVIKNGIDFELPGAAGETLKDYDLQAGRYVVSVARIVPEKRQLDIVEAFTRCGEADFKLVIVGDDGGDAEYSRRLREACEDNARIVMTGFVTGARLSDLLTGAGCFVLASTHEGFSVSVLEAINHKLPVLLSDIGPNREFGLDDRCYFAPGDYRQLARLMLEVMSAPKDVRLLAMRRAEFIAECGWEHVASKTFQVVSAVTDK